MDKAKASSMGSTLDLLRSESLRMDETAPAASLALRSKELLSQPVSESFLFNSSALREGGLTPFTGGFQTVMGMTANDCLTAPPEGPFTFVADLERDCELKTLGTQDFKTFDEFDYSAQVTQPKSQISSGYSTHMASALGAQQLSLTSSTTLHRSCNLRARSAQVIQPTRPQRREPSSSV